MIDSREIKYSREIINQEKKNRFKRNHKLKKNTRFKGNNE
jgi:hypothetical protein